MRRLDQGCLRARIGLALGVAILASGGACGSSSGAARSQEHPRPAPAATDVKCASAPLSTPAGPNTQRCDCGDEATCIARCDGGSASDCYALGGCYSGVGFARDPTKFVTYSARGCERGSASACTNLAKAYATGFGVAPDPSRAERLFASAAEGHRTGCQAGVADDCYMLGYAYEHGEGVEPDPAMTAALRQRACGLGHSASCLLLAVEARSSGSPDEAARWFGVSCETTCTAGCKEIREAIAQGVPTALRVLQQWKDRCNEGQESACRAKRATESGAPSSERN